ncbi:phage head spike fiber domain-containing protein, partial [Solemya velesiana gill symbiont]
GGHRPAHPLRSGGRPPAAHLEAIKDNNEPLVDMPLQTSLAMRKGNGPATFTRSSTATYKDQDGVMQTAAIDEPRFEAEGFLHERASYNTCLQSEDFTAVNWVKQGSLDVTGNTDTAPDGNTTADTLDDSQTGVWTAVQQVVTVADDSYTHCFSSFIKKDADESRFPLLRITLAGGTVTVQADVVFNTRTGESATSVDITDHSAEDWNDEYWRVWVTAINNSTGNTPAILAVYPAVKTALVASGYEQDVTGSIVAWGAQFEQIMPFPTSYIPTTTTAVTRSYDRLQISSENNCPAKSEAQTFAITLKAFGQDSVFHQVPLLVKPNGYRLLRLNNGTGENLNFYKSAALQFGDRYKQLRRYVIAMAASPGNTPFLMSGYVDGELVDSVTTAYTDPVEGVDLIHIGSSGSVNQFNGHLSDFRIYAFEAAPEEVRML